MSPANTLSDKFRLHRTDRIRVDGQEVLSVVEVRADKPTSIEVVVEQCRSDVTETLVVESPKAPLTVKRTIPHVSEMFEADAVDTVTIEGAEGAAVEFVARPAKRSVIRLWNGWRLGPSHHCWLGNSGIVVDELRVPPGADRRLRLWCSDGFGDATFDDLVVVVTLGPAGEDDHFEEE